MARQINYQKNNSIRSLDIENQQESVDAYKDIIIKLIPSEIIAAYTTLVSLIYTQKNPEYLHKIILFTLFVITPIYLYKLTKTKETKQLIMASFAFLIWAISIHTPFEPFYGYDSQFMMTIVLIIYTLIMPLIYMKTTKDINQ